MPREIRPIFVDFNKIGFKGTGRSRIWVYLNTRATIKDLDRSSIELREGMILHVYDADSDSQGRRDDLAAKGAAHFDKQRGEWVAVVETKDVKHVSELRVDPAHWAAKVDWDAIHARERDF